MNNSVEASNSSINLSLIRLSDLQKVFKDIGDTNARVYITSKGEYEYEGEYQVWISCKGITYVVSNSGIKKLYSTVMEDELQ